MKINKYLEELGLTQMDMPGYYNPEEVNEKTEGLPALIVEIKKMNRVFVLMNSLIWTIR